MKEIIKLNERLLRDAKAALEEDGLMLERDHVPKEFEALPPKSQGEINDLRSALNEVIPDDFEYLLCLGRGRPDLMLQYSNGATTLASRGHQWKAGESILQQLRELDWDDERKWAIQGSETFDAITAAAKDLPVMMPSTKALQKHLPDPVRDYIKEKRRDASRVHALLWDGDQSLLDNDFADMDAFEKDLPDIMTCMLHVLTVLAGGKPIPADTIDALKKAALKELEDMPISHAKASGKMEHIFASVGREESR